MVNIIDYLFNKAWKHEHVLGNITKTLRNQKRFNRVVTTFALTMTVYVITEEIYNYEQNKKIEKIRNEIEELKRTKGE